MLPIHRLAQSQQQPSSLTRFRVFWTSRLATRILVLLLASVLFLAWFSPPEGYSSYIKSIGASSLFDQDPGLIPPASPHRPPPPPPSLDHRPPAPPPHDPSPPSPHTPGDSPVIPGNEVNLPSRPSHEKAPSSSVNDWIHRADLVKQSFIFAWNGYVEHAFGFDEVAPVTNQSVLNLNGWGVTIVDSLSTMQLMGLHTEYKKAMKHVRRLKFRDYKGTIPFFETTIRYLGGLLSAYAFTQDDHLLALADQLAETMLPVFNTKSGLPVFGYDPQRYIFASHDYMEKTKSLGWTGGSLLAEIGSCQMEFKYLAHLTGKQEYFNKVENVVDIMEQRQRPNGMWGVQWNPDTGVNHDEHYTVGGLADSAYEYLLKGYLLSGRSEKRLLDMYLKSVNGVFEHHMFLSNTRNLLYVTDVQSGTPEHKLEHLSCFYGGLLALGVEALAGTSDLPSADAELHRWAAEGLTLTCAITYLESPSGLGPEVAKFNNPIQSPNKPWLNEVKKWLKTRKAGHVPPGVRDATPIQLHDVHHANKKDYYYSNPNYFSRPETIESIYMMWKLTNNPVWRERGWEIYQAIEKHMKTPIGYSAIGNVNSKKPALTNSQPSYFFAETLKYLWLLFTQDDPIKLNAYVFNTEAHPLPVFYWTPEEKAAYGI